MQALLFISYGAILGASLRWAIGLLFNPLFSSFAFGTLIANLLGCLIIGVLLGFFWQFHLFGCLAMTVLGIWIYKICSQLLS